MSAAALKAKAQFHVMARLFVRDGRGHEHIGTWYDYCRRGMTKMAACEKVEELERLSGATHQFKVVHQKALLREVVA